VGDPNKQTKMAVSFLMNPVNDVFETFSLRILSSLLIDGQSAPFHQALIDSGMGSEYASSTGYDSSSTQASFSVGLQGISVDQVDQIESIIQRTFESVAETGFNSSRIEAAIHQLELSSKQKTANFGMNISYGLMSNWVHGADPIDAMQINQHIGRLRDELAKGDYFQDLIKRYFLTNNHRLTFVMTPDPHFSENARLNERNRLAAKVTALDEASREAVFQDGLKLAKLQDQKQNLDCLPCLNLKDLSRQAPLYPVKHDHIGKYPVQKRITGTNGISYVRALLSVSDLPVELRPYLPLYTSVSFTVLVSRLICANRR
jgi:Zn-dependent M16 (insulinase) family peptidase